ncbi:uncharacterized protein LOC135385758 [Ornithodoros turicata]|uniref:uncharacterized protein LOC135385758 n=1 Tax=Ornithodoros turicata TaxID=34597 RepID=UPI0031396767
MSSVGAAVTANPSRDESSSLRNEANNMVQESYRIIMPTLPKGEISKNTVFLHGDPSARQYKGQDFVAPLREAVKMKEIASFGSYLFNHVWIVTFHSEAEKEKLRQVGELKVKGRRCMIIDPNSSEVTLKLHWIPMNVSDEVVRRALSTYGKTTDMVREKWRLPGLEGVETTTRSVTIQLKDGVSTESIPYQLKIMGVTVLISVPGKPPLCLRCKQVGHIRSQCRTDYCRSCKGFGHVQEDCVRTYASMTRGWPEKHNEEIVMDIQDTEHAMQQGEEKEQQAAEVNSVAGKGNIREGDPGDNRTTPPECKETVKDWSLVHEAYGKRKGEDTGKNIESAEANQEDILENIKKKACQGRTLEVQLPLEEVGSSQLDDPGFF